MREIIIKTNKNEQYLVYVGTNILDKLDKMLQPAHVKGQKVLIVVDSNTGPLFLNTVSDQLEYLQYEVSSVMIPAGEANKNQASLDLILSRAFEFELGRQDKMLALGGGVVGDITGFAAAIYMRGISYIQVPTTFLAQIDSSVGGKTAIDTPYGKNLLGAFKQPELVIADLKTLDTLQSRELSSAWAEMIKYSLLEGESLFTRLEQHHSLYPDEDLIVRGILAKAKIVAEDVEEKGIRAVLNLGHSFGHALESVSQYTRYTHGEGVALGLLAALRLGEIKHITKNGILARTQSLIQQFNLPVYTDITSEEVLPFLRMDKKSQVDGIKFIFIEDLGKARIEKLEYEALSDLARGLDGYCLAYDKTPKKVQIIPSILQGTICPPPSKSMAHRLIIAVALAKLGETADIKPFISNYQEAISDDILLTTEGIKTILETYQSGTDEMLEVHCGESGSTIRFLIPIAAALGVPVRFTGRGRLPLRPLDAYKEVLSLHGVRLNFLEEGKYLPLEVTGKLQAASYEMPGDVSSQFITGMLFAMALLQEESSLSLNTKLESAPYVDLSLSVLRQFGIKIDVQETPYYVYKVSGESRFTMPSESVSIERDYSQAAFWYLAKFLGHAVDIVGMDKHSLQGDRAFVSCIERFTEREQMGSDGEISIDIADFPDLFPALSIAAATTGEGKYTRLVNAARLKIKESDRLWASYDMLERLGIKSEIGNDYLNLRSVSAYKGGELESYGDHRLAMAGIIAASAAETSSTMNQVQAIEKSYPAFLRDFRRLGGEYIVIA